MSSVLSPFHYFSPELPTLEKTMRHQYFLKPRITGPNWEKHFSNQAIEHFMPDISQTEFEKKILKALRGNNDVKLEVVSIIIDTLRKDPLLRDEVITIVKNELDLRLKS